MNRVFWHIGVPKSGTTFLQANLRAHAKALRREGLQHRGGRGRQFLAALDVTEQGPGWGRTPQEVHGSWLRLCEEAHGFDGDTIISHELFGLASSEQIERAAKALDTLEVHLVVTARDPGRQVIAEWQEGIKHGRHKSFDTFRRRTLDPESKTKHAHRFRASQDLPALLRRWSAIVPADRLHLVTCPPAGAGGEVLWQRFAGAVGIDSNRFPADTEISNASLGAEQVALLRAVNQALAKRLPQPGYGDVVKTRYAQELLANTPGRRLLLPADLSEQMQEWGRAWAEAAAGYRVHGEVTDLIPAEPAASTPGPDEADPQVMLAAAASATAELLLDLDRLRAEVGELRTRLEETKELRKRLRALKARFTSA